MFLLSSLRGSGCALKKTKNQWKKSKQIQLKQRKTLGSLFKLIVSTELLDTFKRFWFQSNL